jgi:hypothetical protein
MLHVLITCDLLLHVKRHAKGCFPLVLECSFKLRFAIYNEREVHRGHARKCRLEL